MAEENNFALVRKRTSAVEKAAPGAKRILSVMVADTLILVKKARPPRIVLVDDEEWLREMLELAIGQCFKDADVLSFGNGDQAWQELLRVEPDLFITDIYRPRLSGLSGSKMLQLLADRKVKFPILVMSGLATEKNVREYAGSDLNYSFLRKPFTTAALYQELLKHLAGKVVDVLAQFHGDDDISQFNLGYCYENGFGVSQDFVKAVKWYRMAAERGHGVAQYNLAQFYIFGRGVEQNSAEALMWTRKAAESGNVVAQWNLGQHYQRGDGVPKDYLEAVKWYRKSAEAGFYQAQYSLGICYEQGHGVSQDIVEAYKFHKLAAEPDQENEAKNFKRIVSRMTAGEIADGELRYREFYSQINLKK